MSNEALIPRSDATPKPLSTRDWEARSLRPSDRGVALADIVNQPLTVLNLLRCLKRCWKTALAWGVLVGFLSMLAIWVLLPPARPHAFSKVYFPPNHTKPLFDHPDPPLNPQTQKELILSSRVLDRVLQNPNVVELPSVQARPNPKQWLRSELAIDFPTGSEIMRITLTGDQPADLRIIVDTVVACYLEIVRDESSDKRQELLERTRENYQKAQDEYEALRMQLFRKGETIGSSSPEAIAAQIKGIQEQLTTLRSRLVMLQARETELLDQRALEEKKLTQPFDPRDPLIARELAADNEYLELLQEKRRLEKRREAEIGFLAPDHPDRVKFQNLLNGLQKQIDARLKELQPALQESQRRKIREDLAKIVPELTRNQQDQSAVMASIHDLEKQLQELKNVAINFETNKADLLQKEETRNRYRLAMQRLTNEFDSPFRGEVLEPATIVIPNDTSRRMKFAMMGMIAGIGFSLLAFALWEYRAHRIGVASEVPAYVGLQVIGTLQRLPIVPKSNVPATSPLRSVVPPHDPSVDLIRSVFLRMTEQGNLRTILITSARHDEGAADFSIQLSSSLARLGNRVILLDCDHKEPMLNRHYPIPEAPGIAEFLRNETPVHASIHPTGYPHLLGMPVGKWDSIASEHLVQGQLATLLEDLRSEAEWIVIHASPASYSAETLQIASLVDGVVLTVRCDESQVDSVRYATQLLNAVGARVLGSVVQLPGKAAQLEA